MHRKFDIRRFLTAIFVGIFAVVGTLVAIEAPARGAISDSNLVVNINQASIAGATGGLFVDAKGNSNLQAYVSATTVRPATSSEPAFFETSTTAGSGDAFLTANIESHFSSGASDNQKEDVSIFTWVKPTTLNHVLVDERGSAYSATPAWYDTVIEMVDGKYNFRVYNCTKIVATSSTSQNTWHQVGFTYDGTTLIGYVDGAQVASGTCADRQAPWEEATNFDLYYGIATNPGTDLNPSGQYYGGFAMAGLQIYSSALTLAQVVSNQPTVNFNANGGTGAMASQSKSSTGTLTRNAFTRTGYTFAGWSTTQNGPLAYGDEGTFGFTSDVDTTLYARWVGKEDSAATLNGTSQMFTKSSAHVIPSTGAFTVEAWLRPNSSHGSLATFISQGGLGGSSTRFYAKIDSSNQVIFFRDGMGGSEKNCGKIPSDAWTHVAISVGTSSHKCFLNGFETIPSTSSSAGNAIGTTFAIGQYSPDMTGIQTWWSGQIDQVKIWSVAITDAALITRSMNTYGNNDGSQISSGLVSHFDFNAPDAAMAVNDAYGSNHLSSSGSPGYTSLVSEDTSSAPGKKLFKFERTYLNYLGGWFSPVADAAASALVVGAGGGGGKSGNPQALTGGSGAGGAVYPISNITLPSTPIRVIVGRGGAGSQSNTGTGNRGGYSALGNLKVAGGAGGNSFQYTGTTQAGEGGADFVAGGNGGAGRQENGTSSAGYAIGGLAGTAQNQIFNGSTFTALQGVVGGRDESDAGTGGRGGQSLVRVSSISGAAVEYGKSPAWAAWGAGLKTLGSGGTTNYGYGTGTINDPGENGAHGVVIVSMQNDTIVNVNFDELNFDFDNVSHIVGATGMSVGNKVLFLNVTNKNGVQVDALVTTEVVSSATIRKYESGASAGGANSYFQTDVDINASNGYVQFMFEFYQHGVTGAAGNPCSSTNTSCANATKVVLQNVNVSAIDIDANQWNDFTLAESYTVAGNTKLKECVIPNSGTCTTRSAPSTFPANMRFQGDSTARTNDPVDMAIVTYAEIGTFRIKFGRSNSGSPNYYGVAFKALDWGSATPQTTGGTNYDIVYNGNGATSGTTGTAHRGSAGTLFTTYGAGTLVKTGYTFAGWDTSSTATTATYAASSKITMPGSNVTLYAVWTPVKYTLTYSSNGGTGAPAAGSHESGTNNVTLSATRPTRTGYVFGGWNTQADGAGANTYGVPATPTVLTYSMPASNTTLYAKWTIADGTLAYDANGGTTTETSVRAQGGTTTTVAGRTNTSRSGYDFAGWNSKADGTGTSYAAGSTFTLVADTTTTIYARWTQSKYNLTFNVNGGVGTPQTQSYVQGATTTLPSTNPTRDGYTFAGWNTAANGSGTNYNGSFQMPGNNLTLYAKWTALTYAVTYDNNVATFSGANGSVTDSTLYEAGQTVAVKRSTGLTYSGSPMHRFIGWNTRADGTGTDYLEESTLTMTASAVRLYAMWMDSSVEIAYNANGGLNAPANDNATIGVTYQIRRTEPNRSGYTFGGWVVLDGPVGTYKVGGTEEFVPDDNYETMVAQWTAINYTVDFDSAGGSTTPATQTAKHIGDVITISSSEPNKNGFTFLGWRDAAGNIYPAGGTFTLGAGNVTLTAQWQGTPYTLTYDANGGSLVSGSGVMQPAPETRNNAVTANLSRTEPTRTGYVFTGWNTQVGGGGSAYAAEAPFQMLAANTTLYAQWSVNSFTLTYNTQGGSTAPTGGSKNYDATITVSSSTITRTGYSFAGWNTSADGTGTSYLANATFKMPNASVTLYAQWTKTAYTLYYNTNGGQGVFSSQPIKYNESVTVDSTLPTRTGYNFIGWNTQAGGGGSDHSARSVYTLNSAANVTLYAKWQAASYSLSYSANGGSGAPSGANYTYDTTVTTAVSGSINRSGYRFIGWNDRDDGSGTTFTESSTFKMPAQNVILYAQWVDSRFQIAYNANGGSGGPDPEEISNVVSGTTTYQVARLAPVRPGHTFLGWKLQDGTPTTNTMKNGTGTDYFVMNGDEVLIAQWEIKTIYVNYDLNGGTSGSSVGPSSGNYDASIDLSTATITRTNFQFSGWSTAPDGSGTTYAAGSSFRLPASDVTLYAKWDPVYFVIEYNAAGGTGEPADQFATPSSTVAIATQEPTKSGYEFDKWTEVSQGTDFNPGGTLTMPSNNVVLVASYTVRAASVPGSGSGSNSSPIDPIKNPVTQPKQLALSVYFQGDSPVLIPRTKLALQKIAKLAKSYGRANNITIYGRVKVTNDKSYDMKLSKARAANVAAYLKKFGVTGVFQVYAKGIAPENNFRARRVDIKLWWSQ